MTELGGTNKLSCWRVLMQRARPEGGQALVEYSLILALIAIVAIAGMTAMAGGIDGMYTSIQGIASAMADALGA